MEKEQFFQLPFSKLNQKPFSRDENKLKTLQFLTSLKCQGGNKADLICYSKKCQQSALTCVEQSCSCSAQHNGCIRLLLKDFIKKIQAKTIDVSLIIDKGTTIIDNFINKIIDVASNLKENFQNISQVKYKYYFLEQQQKNILQKLKKNDVKDLKGQNIYKITNFLFENEKQSFFSIEQQVQNLKTMWNNIQIKFVDELNKISDELNNDNFFVNLGSKHFYNSNIIKTSSQSKTIAQFLNRKIEDIQLLYKASENEFKLKNYYQKCTQIPNTIVLIETQYGKKIGGFTPIQWKKSNSLISIKDKSNTSFIFSLTEKQKLSSIDKQNVFIKYDQNKGPIFGNSAYRDININEKANQYKSPITFNYGFQGIKFNQKTQQNMKLYNGGIKDQVLLKQWQVWKINFAQ